MTASMDPSLARASRILIEVPLRPLQGTRFQPTGFPDLGAALYRLADGESCLLVESAQSMANRMETACWDAANDDWIESLRGIPYVRVVDKAGASVTSSVVESHRINSPYILEGKDKTFFEQLKSELGAVDKGRIDWSKVARTLMKYDPNTLLHGVFLAKQDLAGGRIRVARAVSGFIEARRVEVAPSGGVKKDEVDPSGEAKKGFGHVPFHREEYTGDLTAYFSIDLAQIRGYGLGASAEALLVDLALLKILRVLSDGLRLRTACDLEPAGPAVIKRPEGFVHPSVAELEARMPKRIEACASLFASPVVTTVKYELAK